MSAPNSIIQMNDSFLLEIKHVCLFKSSIDHYNYNSNNKAKHFRLLGNNQTNFTDFDIISSVTNINNINSSSGMKYFRHEYHYNENFLSNLRLFFDKYLILGLIVVGIVTNVASFSVLQVMKKRKICNVATLLQALSVIDTPYLLTNLLLRPLRQFNYKTCAIHIYQSQLVDTNSPYALYYVAIYKIILTAMFQYFLPLSLMAYFSYKVVGNLKNCINILSVNFPLKLSKNMTAAVATTDCNVASDESDCFKKEDKKFHPSALDLKNNKSLKNGLKCKMFTSDDGDNKMMMVQMNEEINDDDNEDGDEDSDAKQHSHASKRVVGFEKLQKKKNRLEGRKKKRCTFLAVTSFFRHKIASVSGSGSQHDDDYIFNNNKMYHYDDDKNNDNHDDPKNNPGNNGRDKDDDVIINEEYPVGIHYAHNNTTTNPNKISDDDNKNGNINNNNNNTNNINNNNINNNNITNNNINIINNNNSNNNSNNATDDFNDNNKNNNAKLNEAFVRNIKLLSEDYIVKKRKQSDINNSCFSSIKRKLFDKKSVTRKNLAKKFLLNKSPSISSSHTTTLTSVATATTTPKHFDMVRYRLKDLRASCKDDVGGKIDSCNSGEENVCNVCSADEDDEEEEENREGDISINANEKCDGAVKAAGFKCAGTRVKVPKQGSDAAEEGKIIGGKIEKKFKIKKTVSPAKKQNQQHLQHNKQGNQFKKQQLPQNSNHLLHQQQKRVAVVASATKLVTVVVIMCAVCSILTVINHTLSGLQQILESTKTFHGRLEKFDHYRRISYIILNFISTANYIFNFSAYCLCSKNFRSVLKDGCLNVCKAVASCFRNPCLKKNHY
ncbi:hypothetical protein HELRODRAFT_181081 [Helobdella robusta]|uniref:Uncharacterized protein n=1 Tax=Helobdella robusta TaxID=6412 RepID=T1FGL5_HELRO|nr:hypothetical protein HELRODRAFT_181081 [Helobdella robusta]ESN93335.1 hypothetical protein HELRODRAFT_181081 [Helobdella robusta]